MGNDPYIVQTLSNAIDLINVFETESEPLSISELAQKTGMNRTTLFRLLYTLKSKGFVEMDPHTGKYRLGFRIVQLSSLVLQRLSIRQMLRPHLERLRNTLNLTVHLVVMNDQKAIFIDKLEVADAIFMGSYVGWVAPMYCTASGKLLLSYQDDSFVSDYLEKVAFKAYTYKTLTEPSRLWQEVQTIRKQGYSVDDEEMVEGLTCYAAPVTDKERIVAAISVSGPTSRMTISREKILHELLSCSRTVSQELATAAGSAWRM